jgi:hypothetical protein
MWLILWKQNNEIVQREEEELHAISTQAMDGIPVVSFEW